MGEEMYYLSRSDINEMLLIGLIVVACFVMGIGFCLYDIYKDKAETLKAKEVKLRDEKRALKRELKKKTSLIKRKEDQIWFLKTIIKEMQGVQKTPPEEIIPFSSRRGKKGNLI